MDRHSTRSLPRYRFVPGASPHPRRDPKGHSYGEPEPKPPPFAPEDWRESEEYLFGVDLYNHGYWWECHEMFEAIWHAVGHETEQGQFLQGIIQVAAANLKRRVGNETAAQDLAAKGLARLRDHPSRYMGADAASFRREAADYFAGRSSEPAVIRIADPPLPPG